MTGSLQCKDSDSNWRNYDAQKRTWDINSNAIFSYGYISAQGKYESSDSCSYKKIIQVAKKWMNGKHVKKTGEISGIFFTIRNGEIIKLYLYAEPTEGGLP